MKSMLHLLLLFIAVFGGCAISEPEDGGDTLRVDRDVPPSEAFDANLGTWSPDGRLIVFSHDRVDPESPAELDELWIADLEAGRRWRVLPGRFLNADWSPDGRELVFHSKSSPEFLFKADTSGQSFMALTGAGSPNPEWRYTSVGRWSPSGDRIAFTVVAGEPRGISVMGPDGEAPEILIPYGISKSWLPDGSGFVYLNWDMTQPEGRRLQIYSADAEGSNVIKLTDFPNSDYLGSPTVSPDGHQIIFRRPGRSTIAELWLMDADGSNARQVTEGEGSVDRPAWHPDGRRVLFGRHVPNVSERLYVLDVETLEVEPVFPEGKTWEESSER